MYIEKNSIWGAEQMHAHMFRNPEGAEEGRRGEAGRHEDMKTWDGQDGVRAERARMRKEISCSREPFIGLARNFGTVEISRNL